MVQSVLKTPEPQMIENAEPLTKEWTASHYTTGDKFRLQKYLDPEPQMIDNEQLPSYEEMQQACQDLFNGSSSVETQPDLAPINVLEEGVAVTQDGRTVEWWPIEGEFDVPNLEELALQEYLMDASKPLHTNFVLPEKGLANGYTCPVYFGNVDSKQTVLDIICNSIHPKLQEEWGTFACHCGLVPTLKLSQTLKKSKQSVPMLSLRTREARCGYFQWIHQVTQTQLMVPKACYTTLPSRND